MSEKSLSRQIRSRPLLVLRLAEDWQPQQAYVDRGEEDLFCAYYLYSRGIRGYIPFVTVCYLLHQAVEKWIKLFIIASRIPINNLRTHDLRLLLTSAATAEPSFAAAIEMVDGVEGRILKQGFPSDLRYEETPVEIEDYCDVLLKTAFLVRRIVKKWLRRLGNGSRI